MGSDDDATIFLDIRPCRGAGRVLFRIEQRGQLDEIDVPRCREPDVRACAGHRGSDESPHAGQEQRRRGNTMDEAALQKALAAGMAGAASDIGKVALWVGQNCKL